VGGLAAWSPVELGGHQLSRGECACHLVDRLAGGERVTPQQGDGLVGRNIEGRSGPRR
jgi:hypothetical protein